MELEVDAAAVEDPTTAKEEDKLEGTTLWVTEGMMDLEEAP